MVLFQKLFQGYIVCFLGDSFGRYVFEQYARETNLKKKRSVTLIELKFGPWGPDPTPKVGSVWSYFLDLSLNPKLNQFFVYTNPIFY